MKKIKDILFSKKNLKRDIGITILSFLAAVSVVRAGNLDSPGSPGSTMYTLSDIYQRLMTNQTADEGDHEFKPVGEPTSSFHTLKEIYEAIPTVDPSKIKLNQSYLGVTGTLTPDGGTANATDLFSGKTANLSNDWNLDTGTLNLACNTSTFDGSDNKVLDAYDGGGNGNNRWCIKDTGNAVAGDILDGKIGWVDGQEITGSMPDIGQQILTPGTSDQLITLGYHNGTGYVHGDTNLISSNIKSGVSIFGVNGNSNVVDTASGDAIAGEIVSGKKAWIDGLEITGTQANVGQQTITPGATSQTITLGYHDGTGSVLGDADLVSGNIRSGVSLFGIDGNSNVVNTTSGNALAADILTGKTAWVDGSEITGIAEILAYGDNNAARVLTTASSTGTYDAENLSASTVKRGTSFGVSNSGEYSGYPGTGWEPNGSGSGSVALNQTNCENAANWKWFEDANGDGDTTDPEDGECIRTATVNSDSWNGAEQMTPNNLGTVATPIAASSGTAGSITVSGASWTADAYKNNIVKIKAGTAVNCWGRVKTNTANTITVYGSWLSTAYAGSCGTPDGTSTFIVSDDWGQYDNSWIGDYSCSGDYPNGTVSLGSYPASGTIALAVTDCYDGKRDLLPNETDRAVINGIATAADATSITDSSQSLDTNVWIGQKVLVTSGTGSGSYGFIESNTATAITVTDWLGGDDPGVGSAFKIIYIVPHAAYTPDALTDGDADDAKANNGPLMAEQLNNWKGTKLPSSSDFFGFCGYRNGGSDYESTTGANSANKSYGNYGGQIGRTDEFMDLANSGSWEWLSEQHNNNGARVAGSSACSYFNFYFVYNSNRFRAVFRP